MSLCIRTREKSCLIINEANKEGVDQSESANANSKSPAKFFSSPPVVRFSPGSLANQSSWTYDNSHIALLAGGKQHGRSAIEFVDPESGQVDFTVTMPQSLSSSNQNLVWTCFTCSAKTTTLFIGQSNGTLLLIDYATRNVLDTIALNALDQGVTSSGFTFSKICLNFDESSIALLCPGSEGPGIIVHSVMSRYSSWLKCLSPIISGGTTRNTIECFEFSYFKKGLMILGTESGQCFLVDVHTDQLFKFSKAHNGPVTGVAFSPFNRYLACSSSLDSRIILYDVEKKSLVKSIQVSIPVGMSMSTSNSPLSAIAFKYDGVTLAVGTISGKVLIYDLRSGSKPLDSLQVPTQQMEGDSGSTIEFLRFSNKPIPNHVKKKINFSSNTGENMKASTASSVGKNSSSSLHNLNQEGKTKSSEISEMFSPLIGKKTLSSGMMVNGTLGANNNSSNYNSNSSNATRNNVVSPYSPPSSHPTSMQSTPSTIVGQQQKAPITGNKPNNTSQSNNKFLVDDLFSPMVTSKSNNSNANFMLVDNDDQLFKREKLEASFNRINKREEDSSTSAIVASAAKKEDPIQQIFNRTSPVEKENLNTINSSSNFKSSVQKNNESPTAMLVDKNFTIVNDKVVKEEERASYVHERQVSFQPPPTSNDIPTKQPISDPISLANSHVINDVNNNNNPNNNHNNLMKMSQNQASSYNNASSDIILDRLDRLENSLNFDLPNQLSNLHLEIIRQFQVQKAELEALLVALAPAKQLAAENERLRAELEQLKFQNMFD